MADPVQYITNAQGDRVSVVLDLASYKWLANPLLNDPDCLVGLNHDELQVLRDVRLKLSSYKLLKLQRVRAVAIEPATNSMSQ